VISPETSAWMLIIHKGLGFFLCDFSISEWKPLTRNSGQAVLPWILAPWGCHVTCYIDRGIDPWADNDTLDKIRSTTCEFMISTALQEFFPSNLLVYPFLSGQVLVFALVCKQFGTFPSPGFSWDRQFQRVSTNAGQYSQTRPEHFCASNGR